MVNYNRAKIYKIVPTVDFEEGEIYFGSTIKEYLSQRMDRHRSGYKSWKNNKSDFVYVYKLFEKYGVDNCNIILVELVNCNSKNELLEREKHYIKSNKCVNKYIPILTVEEKKQQLNKYAEINKDKIILYQKEYRANNTEKIKEYREKNFDKFKEYNEINAEHLKQYRKDYNKLNADKRKECYKQNCEDIKAQRRVKCNCHCGSVFNYGDKSRHVKTLKHQSFINQQNQ